MNMRLNYQDLLQPDVALRRKEKEAEKIEEDKILQAKKVNEFLGWNKDTWFVPVKQK